jgi:hypothetical protein
VQSKWPLAAFWFPVQSLSKDESSRETELLRSGVNVKVISERFGHSSVAITLDLYSHVDVGMRGEAADKLDAAFDLAKTAASRQK